MNRASNAAARCALLALSLALLLAGLASAASRTQIKTGQLLSTGTTVITDANDLTLYASTGDKPGRSNCYGSCTKIWKPLLASGKLAAGKGVNAKLLGTTTRNDGKRQVTYAGHPLYLFMYPNPYLGGRTSEPTGGAYGQGCSATGKHDGNPRHAHWWVVVPTGSLNKRVPAGC